MPETESKAIGWRDFLTFLSPDGQRQIVEFVREAKETRGEHWLPQIKAEFPMFSWIVELVATRTADDAFTELQKAFPSYPLWIVRTQLTNLHGLLLAEIEKPR